MKLRKGYYWIKSITILRGAKIPHKTENNELGIGYYEGDKCLDGSKNIYPWSIIGSDMIFKNYESDDKVGHNETHIIPVRRVEE